MSPSSILTTITSSKVLIFLTGAAILLGIATEAVVLWGQSQEATIKNQIAINAPLLKEAEAEKTAAETRKNEALAINAKIREKTEAKYKTENAIVETAIAKYAERMKRAEADKLQAEAASETEIAKWSDVQQRAEAKKSEMEGLKASGDAAISQWVSYCQVVQAPGPGAVSDCSSALVDAVLGPSSIFYGITRRSMNYQNHQ